MSGAHLWLTEAQFARLQPLLPNKPRGVPRVDDRRVISGILHVLRNGLMWRDAPACYGPYKTLYNRFVRWSAAGRVRPVVHGAGRRAGRERLGYARQHAYHRPSHGSQSAKKGVLPRAIGRTRGGLTSKLHAVCDGAGRPVTFLLTAGQVSDMRGAEHLLPTLPPATTLLADKGYDSDRFRAALTRRAHHSLHPGPRPPQETDCL